MMRIEPEISSVSIVLVGSFNPPIFHPEWFASHRLISDREKEAAEVEIIHREIALFRMEWLSVRVATHLRRDSPVAPLSIQQGARP